MENKIPFLELISDVINKYEFTRLKQIDAIVSNKLEIFLAGLPNSGKTTFLNALLGLSRKELYESTKKATKCIFKISYGDIYSYKRINEEVQLMPESIEDRKDLISNLNSVDNFVELYLPVEFLKNINIYDFPGLFSGDKTDNNYDSVVKSSDLVIFLKTSDDMCSPDELSLLNDILLNGANYIVLFSFEDILDRQLKNNITEFNSYLEKKLSEYPSTPKYFSISSEDFYRNNEKGNVINVIKFISNELEKFKSESVLKKIDFTAKEYIRLLKIQLGEVENIIIQEKEKINDKYNIKISRNKLQDDEKLIDFKITLKENLDSLMFEFKKSLSLDVKSKTDLETIWSEHISNMNIVAQRTLKEDTLLEEPELPDYDEVILSNSNWKTILDKIIPLLRSDSENYKEGEDKDDFIALIRKFAEQTNNDNDIDESEVLDILKAKFKTIISNADYDQIYNELVAYLKYISAVKSFLQLSKTTLQKINSKYVNILEAEIGNELNTLLEQKALSISDVEKNLVDEFKLVDIRSDINKLKEFIIEK